MRMKEITKPLETEVKDRIKSGQYADDKGNPKSFEPLSESYKKQRTKMNLSPDTSPTTSNVIQTGKMVDSIKATNKQSTINISVRSKKNLEKAKYVTEGGRPFLSNLTQQEILNVKESFIKILKEEIEKLL